MGIWLVPLWGWAQGIPVRTAEFRVYEKQLSGFEILLPASRERTRESIVDHLGQYLNQITTFEDMVFCEEVHYAPVSVWQPLTLVYQVQAESPRLTRLKVAALADFRFSVTVEQAPDLALRLLLDLDQMARSISGDSLDFNALFVDVSSRQLVAKYKARTAAHTWNMAVERRPEEVLEQTGLLLRKESLRPDNQATAADDSIIALVSRRFSDYINRQDEGPFVSERESEAVAAFRDSLELVSGVLAESHRIRQQLVFQRDSLSLAYDQVRLEAGDLPVEVHMRLAALEQENQQLREQLEAGRDADLPPADSLMAAQEVLERAYDSVQNRNRKVQMQLREKEQELGVVFARLERLEQEAMPPEPEKEDVEAKWRELTRQWAVEREDLEADIRSLQHFNDSLSLVVMALNPESEKARAQQAVYMRRIRQLDEAQDRLVQRLWAVSNREKLIRQREQFLADYERSGNEAALLKRVSELEEALRTTYARMEQGTDRLGNTLVEPAVLRIEDRQIPAFAVKTALPVSWTREQIRSWARLHDLRVVGDDILSLTSARLPGLEGTRFTWEMTMLERSRGAIIYATFQLPNGSYLDVTEGDLKSRLAVNLLEDVFR